MAPRRYAGSNPAGTTHSINPEETHMADDQNYDEMYQIRPVDSLPTEPAMPPAYSERVYQPVSQGLSYTAELRHGLTYATLEFVMTDLGRLTRDRIMETATLDLRIILAHLDSAAAVIQAELGDR